MQTINLKDQQTVFDVCLQQFGTLEALYLILQENDQALDEIEQSVKIVQPSADLLDSPVKSQLSKKVVSSL